MNQYHLSLSFTGLLFIGMLVMNTLANSLPLNGQTTGGVSYQYPNLFQPAGVTFSIWGVIYLLLGAFVVSQFMSWKTDVTTLDYPITTILWLFSITSLFNIGWLVLWHYDQIALSTVVMVLLLATLLVILYLAKDAPLLLRASFSVYAGWISIATVANFTILFVKLGVEPFTEKAVAYTIIMFVISALLGIFYMFIKKNIFYGAVFIWAFVGIFIRFLKQEGLPQSFPALMYTSLTLLIILAGSVIYLGYDTLK
ncbi:MAG TPA: tryptophan-rich sensory protein [Acholeplasmataceae bacterium]|nr:tryptophan-rich sensory protein [Acholeplasmataceae bacterium]